MQKSRKNFVNSVLECEHSHLRACYTVDIMIMLPDYRVRQRDYLLNISRALTEQLDTREVLRRVLEASAAMLSGEIGLIALRNEADVLEVQAAYGLEADQIGYFDPLIDDLQNVGVDAERMNLRARQIAKLLDIPLRQVVALPLTLAGEAPLGLILVFRSFSGVTTDNDRQILQSFADQAAIAVQNARLYATVNSEKQRLSAILEHSADGIMILDHDRRILRFNQALAQLTAWQPDMAIGRLDTEVLRWQQRQSDTDLDTMLAGDWPPDQTLYMEGDIERLDGLSVSIGVTYALLRRDDGRPANIIANVRDITHFRKADEMKSTFISVISHELKTPVALIKGYAGTLRRKDAQWDKLAYDEALSVIEDEADRLTGLIENLLAATKLQAEGMRLRLTDIHLGELAERAAERFATQTDQHTLHCAIDPDLPYIQGDETRLRQVLDNLLSNAIKYSPQGGAITVRVWADAAEAYVAVSDEGIGLRPDQLEHVFERFYRADAALTSTTQGTGLGLFLARAVVEAHGGRIWAESDGHGSTFTFSLPLEG